MHRADWCTPAHGLRVLSSTGNDVHLQGSRCRGRHHRQFCNHNTRVIDGVTCVEVYDTVLRTAHHTLVCPGGRTGKLNEKCVCTAGSAAELEFHEQRRLSPLESIKLTAVMERTSGMAEVKIGLIDGPVFVQHADLAAEHIREIPGNNQAMCAQTNSTACIHGTFIAGIRAAKRISSAPAICPGCTLLIRPIFTEASSGASTCRALLLWRLPRQSMRIREIHTSSLERYFRTMRTFLPNRIARPGRVPVLIATKGDTIS